MLVFIDESGDPGFKLGEGSSDVFVLAMVMFANEVDAQHAQALISSLQESYRISPEWKFSKTSNVMRDNFFNGISNLNFTCRSVVVRKEIIRSDNLRSNPRRFYNFFTNMMCKHNNGSLNEAKIVIDGSGDREFKRELQAYMRKELPTGTIKKMGFKDSRKDQLVQLADMCVGAIARSYSGNRDNQGRWRQMLQQAGQIDDIWDFK